MRRIAEAVDRTAAGSGDPIPVAGDDEIARLAETQNRLAADVDRRNRELAQIRAAAASASPEGGVEPLLWVARVEVVEAFGLIDAHVLRVDPESVPIEDRVPGEAIPIRAELRAGEDRLGLITGRLPATRSWARRTRTSWSCTASSWGSRCGTPTSSPAWSSRIVRCGPRTRRRTTSSAA
jgi:hypothetical protein